MVNQTDVLPVRLGQWIVLICVSLGPRICDAQDDTSLTTLVHREVLYLVAAAIDVIEYSPEGDHLAWSSERAARVEVWDTESLTVTDMIRYGGAFDLSFASDATSLVLFGDGVLTWDLQRRVLTFVEDRYRGEIEYLRGESTVRGDVIAGLGPPDLVTLWNTERRARVHTLRHGRAIDDFDLSTDGRMVASCSGSRNGVVLWDVESGERVGNFAVSATAPADDGSRAVGNDMQGEDEPVTRGVYPPFPVLVRFTPDSQACVVLMDRYEQRPRFSVEVWRLSRVDGRISARMRGQVGIPPETAVLKSNMAVSHNGRLVAVCAKRGSGAILDVEELRMIATFQHPDTDPARVEPDPYGTMTVSFDPDGTALASGHADGSIVFWNIPSQEE